MSHSVPTEKTNIPSSAAFWAVLIFIGLILAAVNFVKAESGGEGHGEHGEAKTEHVEGGGSHEGEHATEAHGEATTEAAKPATEATTEAAATHASTDTTKAATTEEAHH